MLSVLSCSRNCVLCCGKCHDKSNDDSAFAMELPASAINSQYHCATKRVAFLFHANEESVFPENNYDRRKKSVRFDMTQGFKMCIY